MITTITSVIIPCYLIPGGGDVYPENELLQLTQRCINSLRWHCNGFELVLVDNGSPIGGDYLREQADVYVRFQENRGFAPAVNAGFRVASGDWLVACNNDIEFIHDWLSTARESWESGVGAVSSHLHDNDKGHGVGLQFVGIGYMFGALWMTRRDVLDEVGYLDEGYERGMFEDKDFWRRLEVNGYRLCKVGWVNHAGNATWGKLPGQHEIYLRNKARYEANNDGILR